MTDDRPRPKYGEDAPLPAEPVAPVAPVEEPAPPAPEPAPQQPLRTGDVILTTLLLLVGVTDVVGSFPLFASISGQLTAVYAQLGVGGTSASPLAEPLGLAINVVRVVVLAAAVIVSLLFIQRRRRAYWVPLAGYVLAGILAGVLVLIIMLNDPTYLDWVTKNS